MGRGGAGAAGASTGAVTASARLLVVVNPHAGRGAAAAAWAAAEPILRAAGCTPQLVETKRPGHARELLAALPRGACDAVVVAGGDGSLHEAVNGLMAAGTPRPPLGLIPAGTGNSLAADLECLDPHQAARAIADGRTRPLDVMEVRLGPAAKARRLSRPRAYGKSLAPIWICGARVVLGAIGPDEQEALKRLEARCCVFVMKKADRC